MKERSDVPLIAPAREYAELRDAIYASLARVLVSGRFVLGEAVERFEAAVVVYVSARVAVGDWSGSAALRLSRVAVGIGPGSYGGVRVGIAVANGLALALGAQTVGLSSLEAISEFDDYAVTGDARRKSFFVARVKQGKLAGEPELLDEAALSDRLGDLRDNGIPVVTSDESVAGRFPGVELAFPLARRLAVTGAAMPEPEFATRSGQTLEPHYLRAPYITTPRK